MVGVDVGDVPGWRESGLEPVVSDRWYVHAVSYRYGDLMAQNRNYSSTTRRTLTTADPGTSGVSLAVSDSTVFSSLDSTFPWTALINWGQSDQEIVNVTARPDGTHLTIQRGQDGTSGVAHAVGATVDHGVSARDFNESGSHIGASASVHGVSGSVVGTTSTQTLTNKTLTAPVLPTFQDLTEQSSVPASPSAGTLRVFPLTTTEVVSSVKSSGAVADLSPAVAIGSASVGLSSTNAYSTITGLSLSVANSGSYLLEAYLNWSANTSGAVPGFGASLGGTASLSFCTYTLIVNYASDAGGTTGSVNTFGFVANTVTAANCPRSSAITASSTTYGARLTGAFTVGASGAGTVLIQGVTGTATVTVAAGGLFILRRVA